MKSGNLENYRPIEEFYSSGKIKNRKYLIHMSYIVVSFDESGEKIGLKVNGIEYPPDYELEFREDQKILVVKPS